MILVLKSWFHVEDAIYHTENWKVYVAKQKNIGVSDMFTVKTITVLHYIVSNNYYFFLSKAIIQDTICLTSL
jgi:hypothetical protein